MSFSKVEPDYPSALDATDPDRYSLPDTMSGLLTVAINDARNLDPELYHPRSDTWHNASYNNVCSVCLCGSIIANTFNAPPHRSFLPTFFGLDNCRKFDALDLMRLGSWYSANIKFYKRIPPSAIGDRLKLLPDPSNPNFIGWHSFHAHLDSLETINVELAAIERSDGRIRP